MLSVSALTSPQTDFLIGNSKKMGSFLETYLRLRSAVDVDGFIKLERVAKTSEQE